MSSSPNSNPLVSLQFRIPFDQIQAADVQPAIARLLANAREHLESLAAAQASRTFANTMQALDQLTEPLDYAMSVVRHLEAVTTYPELRAAYNAVQPETSAFYSKIPLHTELWRAIRSYAATAEAAALTGERRRFLHKTMDTF